MPASTMDLRRPHIQQRRSAMPATGLSRQWIARIRGSVRGLLPTWEETPTLSLTSERRCVGGCDTQRRDRFTRRAKTCLVVSPLWLTCRGNQGCPHDTAAGHDAKRSKAQQAHFPRIRGHRKK